MNPFWFITCTSTAWLWAICAAGSIGDAGKGLEILLKKKRFSSSRAERYFAKSFFQHAPLFREGKILSRTQGVRAALDLSDSLMESLSLLLHGSGLGLRFPVENIPVSSLYKKGFACDESLLTGGEDYGLLFAVDPKALPVLRRKMSFSVLGKVSGQEKGVVATKNGRPLPPPRLFQHFGS